VHFSHTEREKRARIKMASSSSSSSSSSSKHKAVVSDADHHRENALVDCSWRVDVTLSSSQAKKVLRPTILMRLETKKKRFCGEEEDEEEEEESAVTTRRKRRETVFEMSLEMFQELRVSVAKILTEMEWANEELKRT
jgi:hypothetical protein